MKSKVKSAAKFLTKLTLAAASQAAALVAFLFFSQMSMAHVKPGSYTGLDEANKPCSVKVGDVWFEDNFPHPLTERLVVSHVVFEGQVIDQVSWNLGHPPFVNLTTGVNRFNHDLFQQIEPTPTGANSLTLFKAEGTHNPGEEEVELPPSKIIFQIDNYRDKTKSKQLVCRF